MSAMVAKYEAAARHLPVAHGPVARDAKRSRGVRELQTQLQGQTEPRRTSETRLQAAVVADRNRDEKDPYADVPCTD